MVVHILMSGWHLGELNRLDSWRYAMREEGGVLFVAVPKFYGTTLRLPVINLDLTLALLDHSTSTRLQH